MAKSLRQKLAITALVIYWPALFFVAHIPIPPVVRQAGVSDKSLHFVGYMVLFFLIWTAVRPNTRVNWRKASVWIVLVIVVWYGAVDEGLQAFDPNRSGDIKDFFADLIGTVFALVIMTFFYFWPSAIIITGVTILALTNFTKADLATLLPVTNTAMNLLGYAFFTMLWAKQLSRTGFNRYGLLKWYVILLSVPIGLLILVIISAKYMNSGSNKPEPFAAVIGIVTASVIWTILIYRKKVRASAKGLSEADSQLQ